MSEIYANAVDSLRIGIEFFLKEPGYTSRKHAILTLFHAIGLLLKEQLYRTNPILIYRNIDAKITEDSLTVGIKEILVRLENIGLGLPKLPRAIIENIQKRRNRIEHHRYDHKDEDELIIAESLKFILFFADDVLKMKLEVDISAEILREIQRIVYEHESLPYIASHRLTSWMHDTWPEWSDEETDTPDEFSGTIDCPICSKTFLVIGYHDRPFCFYCNTSVDAAKCENCGTTHLVSIGCYSCAADEQDA